jgi:outer membrane protein TolC
LDVRLAIYNLAISWQEITLAKDECEARKSTLDDTVTRFGTGGASADSLDEAKVNLMNANIALYERLSVYTDEMIGINAMTGGWLAIHTGWYGELFKTLPPEALPEEPQTGGDSAAETETPEPEPIPPELAAIAKG